MHWQDEGFLLSKNNFSENSIIIEVFTSKYGKYSGIVYGGSSRKQKRIFQIGNKIFLNWNSKGTNNSGYFKVELIKPITPPFFDDRKRISSILSASSILRILLPERQNNHKIYESFNKMLIDLKSAHWIKKYIQWELFLIKELGFEINLSNYINGRKISKESILINNKIFKIPRLIASSNNDEIFIDQEIKEALIFNKNLLIENFILPNNLKLPIFRNKLEKYY